MIRFDNVSCFSLNELLKIESESEIDTYISRFVCSKNAEIESYLKNNALEFNRKHQAISYLLFDRDRNVIAYFALSVKPINIKIEQLSHNEMKKLLRITEIDINNDSLNPSAYLIAQIGKKDNSTINLDTILKFVNYYINNAQNICGGVVEFLESENNDKLIALYQSRGFKTFNIRKSKSGDERKLVQMYRLIWGTLRMLKLSIIMYIKII